MAEERGGVPRRAITIVLVTALVGLSWVVNQTTAGAAGHGATAARLQVVAAENFWGSIASQEGGTRVHVTSIIVNPNTDPHSYEATPADARTVAHARYVILNGAGYDTWGQKLLSANPVSGRALLDVGNLVGRKAGDNPHVWYNPAFVMRVAAAITAEYKRLDPHGATYYDQLHAHFVNVALHPYHQLIASIQHRFHGTPVGATESIFVDLAAGLQLRLTTPSAFMKAVAEGTEPTPRDKATFDQQVTGRQIRVLVYNRQNSTPDVEALKSKATAAHIPVVAITETLYPGSVTFQAWQDAQLSALEGALHTATGH